MLGTNIEAEQLSDAEVIAGYKGQAQAEGGFRFLKDPLFFVSSLFVKKPCRIQGLLMVMTLALAGLFGGATSSAPGIEPVKTRRSRIKSTNRPIVRPCGGCFKCWKGLSASA